MAAEGDPSTASGPPFVPSAITEFSGLISALSDGKPAIFLDYDGTLTPIVDRPEYAVLSQTVRARLARLAAVCPLAIISGRDLDDVTRLVGLKELVYAGSHGFDIRGPGVRRRIGEEALPVLDRAESEIRRKLVGFAGVVVERKRFAVAVHTRVAESEAKPAIAEAVRAATVPFPELRLTGGKEIHELRPDLPWDKGHAVLALLETMNLDSAVPVFVGDDETDEDAFRVLKGLGVCVRVMEAPGPTEAAWRLDGPDDVAVFLDRLADWLEGRS